MMSHLQPGYGFAILGACMAGFHMFSMKLFSIYSEYFYSVLAFVVFTMVLSRLCIYYAMNSIENPTLVHLILNCSIFVTFFLSVVWLGLKEFNLYLFLFGLVLTIAGMACIQYSYKSN